MKADTRRTSFLSVPSCSANGKSKIVLYANAALCACPKLRKSVAWKGCRESLIYKLDLSLQSACQALMNTLASRLKVDSSSDPENDDRIFLEQNLQTCPAFA